MAIFSDFMKGTEMAFVLIESDGSYQDNDCTVLCILFVDTGHFNNRNAEILFHLLDESRRGRVMLKSRTCLYERKIPEVDKESLLQNFFLKSVKTGQGQMGTSDKVCPF
jgi:hypothetical protein